MTFPSWPHMGLLVTRDLPIFFIKSHRYAQAQALSRARCDTELFMTKGVHPSKLNHCVTPARLFGCN